MENLLKQVFEDKFFSENITNFNLEETADDGKCVLTINPISKIYNLDTNSLKPIIYNNIFKNNDLFRKICDGITIKFDSDCTQLFLFEMKKSFRYNTFEKAIKQLEGSYLKLAMIFSLFGEIKNIEIKLFIVKNQINIDDLKHASSEREKGNKLAGVFIRLINDSEAILENFPYYSASTLHNNLKKANISIKLESCGNTLQI